MGYLFVSRDLNVTRPQCDRVRVMYLGQVVESAPTDEVFHASANPCTSALIGLLARGLARYSEVAPTLEDLGARRASRHFPAVVHCVRN